MRERPSGSFLIGNRPSFIVALGRQYQRPRMNLCRTASGILAVGCLLVLTPAAGHSAAAENDNKTSYDYSLVAFDGKEAPLSTFKGKVLLVVNLASQSIFKEQIPQLEELQKKYRTRDWLLWVSRATILALKSREPMRKYRRGTPTSFT